MRALCIDMTDAAREFEREGGRESVDLMSRYFRETGERGATKLS
jgi:hypothetical protein